MCGGGGPSPAQKTYLPHLDFGKQIKLLEIIDRLAEAGLSVIMSSHFPDHAFLSSTKVAIMKNKKVIDFGALEM